MAQRPAPLEQLRTTCETLRDELTTLYEQRSSRPFDDKSTSQRRWRVVLLLSAMKSGLRDTFLAADARRTCVQEQKDVAEAHQLQLQNLLYEKDHLVREIERCRGFSAKEMDKIEFVDGNVPITADGDAHRQHLAQLTQELHRRKSLQVELKQLKLQVVDVQNKTKTKRAFLDSLPDQLAQIEAATMGLQKVMGQPVTAQRKRREAAEMELATPLYALYCELEAYQIASGDAGESLRLDIVDACGVKMDQGPFRKREFPLAFDRQDRSVVAGSKRHKTVSRSPSAGASRAVSPAADNCAPSRSPSIKRGAEAAQEPEKGEIVVALHTAEKLLELRPHASPIEDEEMKEVDVEPKHSGLALDGIADVSPSAENLWMPHAKALQLTVAVRVPVDNDKSNDAAKHVTRSFTVMFQYFPVARIVTAGVVKTSASASSDSGGHQHSILMNLFPGDDGLTVPQLAVNYAFRDGSDKRAEVAFPVTATCRPYFWAQWICGLNPTKRPDQSISDNDAGMEKRRRRPEPSIRNVMEQLSKRFVATAVLKKHLNVLAKCTGRPISSVDDGARFVHPLARQLFPCEVKTHLEEWKEVPAPVRDVFLHFGDSAASSSRPHARFHLSTTGCRYFRACFKNGGTKVSAMVEISPEYPVRAPRFIFQPRSSTSSKAVDKDQLPVYENRLKDIEIEVNAYYDELIPQGSEHFLVLHQLRKIEQCFDVLCSAAADGGADASLSFVRERRGKDRRQAIVMDAAAKELRQR